MLTGKKALITGGDSNRGQAVAIFWTIEGAHIALYYLFLGGGGVIYPNE
jgi:NAD(P)-dependent dehydrogenase (short-subunit alcohol dehydrogenase family)